VFNHNEKSEEIKKTPEEKVVFPLKNKQGGPQQRSGGYGEVAVSCHC
jgi:hypothetical protein